LPDSLLQEKSDRGEFKIHAVEYIVLFFAHKKKIELLCTLHYTFFKLIGRDLAKSSTVSKCNCSRKTLLCGKQHNRQNKASRLEENRITT